MASERNGLPTLEDLKELPVIRFPAGNRILYGEDFQYYQGIPANVDWYISGNKRGVVSLVRPGHGVAGDYGNGSLLVHAEHLGLGSEA